MKKQVRNKLRGSAGFTLVELIVVIAILGILAGIGTVGYSGYIKKANQAADIQLIGDVQYAIELAYAADPGSFAGKQDAVVLTSESAPRYLVADGPVKKALEMSFGDPSTLRLKYSGWTDALTMLNNATNRFAASVGESSYINGVGTAQLLTDVQDCATSLGSFLNGITANNIGETGTALEYYLGSSLGEMLAASGMAQSNGNGTYDYSNATSEALANATVFCLANKMQTDTAYADDMATACANGQMLFMPAQNAFRGPDALYSIACWYAAMEGYVAYLDDPDCTEAFQNIDMSGTNPNAILANMDNARTTILNKVLGTDEAAQDALAGAILTGGGCPASANELGQKMYGYFHPADGGTSQAQLDNNAFRAVMSTVDNLSDDYSDKASLNNGGLFAGSAMNDRINSYVAAASLSTADITAIQGMASGDSMVVVTVSADNNGHHQTAVCK